MIYLPLIMAAVVLVFAVAAYRSEVTHSKAVHNYKQSKKKYHA